MKYSVKENMKTNSKTSCAKIARAIRVNLENKSFNSLIKILVLFYHIILLCVNILANLLIIKICLFAVDNKIKTS